MPSWGTTAILSLSFFASDMTSNPSMVAVPVVGGAVLEFVQEHWPTPFREKQQGVTGANDAIALPTATARPGSKHRVLGMNQMLGAFAIPIGPVGLTGLGGQRNEPPRGEPAHALQAVKVVERIDAAGAGVVRHGIVLAEPLRAPVDELDSAGVVRHATLDTIAGHTGVARLHAVGGDHQRGDAGACHAARAHGVEPGVAPRAVVVLASFPILLGPYPRFIAGRHPDALSLVQRQQRELGIGIIAVGADHRHTRIRPGPDEPVVGIAAANLGLLQPRHVVADKQEILFGLGPGKDHRLQRNHVRPVGPEFAKVLECSPHGIVIGLDAAVQQRQRA